MSESIVFDPRSDSCESAFKKWMLAGEYIGKNISKAEEANLWFACKMARECSAEIADLKGDT